MNLSLRRCTRQVVRVASIVVIRVHEDAECSFFQMMYDVNSVPPVSFGGFQESVTVLLVTFVMSRGPSGGLGGSG